jgi:hypothetical protein
MAHRDEPLPLSRLQLAHDLLEEYRDFLPELPLDEARRIGGEQEIIARYERDKAVSTLPLLLGDARDRQRLLTLLDRVLADKRVQRIRPSAEQTRCLPASAACSRRRKRLRMPNAAATDRRRPGARASVVRETPTARPPDIERSRFVSVDRNLAGLPFEATLRDGTGVCVRAIRPTTRNGCKARSHGFRRAAVYQRFFHPVTELTSDGSSALT